MNRGHVTLGKAASSSAAVVHGFQELLHSAGLSQLGSQARR
jgi:hypothetical protein